MKTKASSRGQINSYLALRKAVGWIGILLPFVLMFGVFLLFHGKLPLFTISMYYYTGMRDVLVGALCAIGLFMFFYRGYDKWDNITGNIVGFCAICIAWFPATKLGPLDLSGKIHFTAACIFFLMLAFFSLGLFTRKGPNPTARKLKRNIIYIVCGLVMIACLIGMLIFFVFLQGSHPDSTFAFWAETVALIAFGVSWLTKGGTFYPDRKPGQKAARLPD
ncbi:MAG: DUF998 domain-containing protein [Bacteroidota bacterium]|nr:DUF998 domain-containing protein [Bacteroidota bacterium]